MVKVCTEPLLRTLAPQQLIDKRLKVLRHHRAVMDDVLGLNKVEAVVKRSRSKLHSHLIGDIVERHEIGSILVLDGHAKANILHAHLTKFLQRLISTLVAVLKTADLVVSLLKPLNRDTNTDLRNLLCKSNDTICKEAICADNNTV